MFEPLDKHHDRTAFDCGQDDINRYLQTMASQHAKRGISQTHVLADDSVIKAFYSLTVGGLDNHAKIISGYPNHIPTVVIGRIGVSKDYQGQGLAKMAIAHALHAIKQISHMAGVAVVTIHAKDEALARYYERLGFIRLVDSLTLFYPVSQI